VQEICPQLGVTAEKPHEVPLQGCTE